MSDFVQLPDASTTRGRDLERIDDAWMLRTTTRERITLHNPRTDHVFELWTDHVHDYMSDITGRTGGFLILRSQVSLSRRGVFVEPIQSLPTRLEVANH